MPDEASGILLPIGQKADITTREEAAQIWKDARNIYAQSRLPDVRRAAKRIALVVESYFDKLGIPPADSWEI